MKIGSVAAAVLVTLAGMAVARRQWTNAQSTILANSVPLADPAPVPVVIDDQLPSETADSDVSDVAATQLAEAEPSRPTETPASGIDAVAAPKPSPHTRFGFDLEHGTPMPARYCAKPSPCIDREFQSSSLVSVLIARSARTARFIAPASRTHFWIIRNVRLSNEHMNFHSNDIFVGADPLSGGRSDFSLHWLPSSASWASAVRGPGRSASGERRAGGG